MASDSFTAPVSVAYRATFVRAGKRKPETLWARASVPVRFRRLAMSDLKRAIELHPGDGYDAGLRRASTLYGFEDGMWSAAGGGYRYVPPAEMPDFEEGNFLAAIAAPSPEAFEHLENPFAMTGNQIRVTAPGFERRKPQNFGMRDLPRVEDIDVREVRPETEAALAAAAANAQRVADALVFADGRPLFRRHDPYWTVSAGVISLHHGHDEHPKSWKDIRFDSTFRVDRPEQAKRWHDEVTTQVEVAPRDQRPRREARYLGHAEILDGSFLTRDDMSGYTQGLGPTIVEMLPLLADAGEDKLLAWVRARDLCRKLDTDWNRADAERMLGEFAAAGSAAVATFTNRSRAMPRHLRHAAGMCAAVVRRAESFDGMKFETTIGAEGDAALDALATEVAP